MASHSRRAALPAAPSDPQPPHHRDRHRPHPEPQSPEQVTPLAAAPAPRPARSPGAHRAPRLPRTPVRAALSLALASAASVSLLGEGAQAEPEPGRAAVEAQVEALYRQADAATQDYDGAKAKAETARQDVARLQDELARKTAGMNATRDELGTIAAAQYRSGTLDPALQLALSSSPDSYLQQVGALDQLGGRQSAVLAQLAGQKRDIEQTRTQAGAKLAALKAAQAQLADRKKAVQDKLRRARKLLARLTPPQRAAVESADGPAAPTAVPAADRGTSRAPIGTLPAPSSRAAQAVAFAYRALGLPYVWGATGPNAYDCSGLTQAAWRAAGVALPRTTYTQINAGTRVPESQLRPGDLVFFYSGISHVGIYIGDGRMIHAPHPGAAVRIAPISEMPFAGATRPV